MTALEWDQVGDRRFETGVDRAVLFLNDGRAVAWNGLTGVEDSTTPEVQDHFMDGVKFLQRFIPGDYSGTLKAYTYPREFDEVLGTKSIYPGMFYHDQPGQSFSLCYRTRVGNDVEGIDYGYKIHILYNLFAVPSAKSFSTLGDVVQPEEFMWTLSGTPPSGAPLPFAGYRPTVHVSFDTYGPDPFQINDLEEILYGTDTTDPYLPSPDDLGDLFIHGGELRITDHGDGTWTASDPGNNFITMTDSTTFEIDDADVVYLDANTYNISDTSVEP